MSIYVNGELRTDVCPLVGGDIGQNSDNVTDSTINVAVPISSEKQLQECDVLKIVEESGTVYAGVILKSDQLDMGTYPDFSVRWFKLTMASNAYLLAKVFTDMQFPEGASVTQILMGNINGNTWFNPALAEFTGLIATRIFPEGIEMGVLDDFRSVILNAPALLWGQPITDTLDALASAAGAWWEITVDRVFNMRYKFSRIAAPFSLDANCSEAYDLAASRDACTMYSAVRVIGGSGQGAYKHAVNSMQDDFNSGDLIIKDNKTIQLKYPVHSFAEADTPNLWVLYEGTQYLYLVGFKGVNDTDSRYQALTSYGSDTITLKDGYNFPTVSTGNVQLYYYPLIPIVVRLVDPVLSAEIIAQRGGTGVVEALVTDKNITGFSAATQAASTFLDENAKRALNVTFKTKNPNFRPGQILPGNLPYYNVVGDYQVTETKGSLISSDTSANGIWEFTIQASTAAYRDGLKSLFYLAKRTEFKLGTDFPANDGVLITADIEIKTEISIRAADPPTWAELDAKQLTWAQIEAEGKTWAEIENTIDNLTVTGDCLTTLAKSKFLTMFQGSSANYSALNLSKYFYLFAGNTLLQRVMPYKTTWGAAGVTNYYDVPQSVLNRSTTDLKTSVTANAEYLQSISAAHDYPGQAAPELFITKTDTIISTYTTAAAKTQIARIFAGENVTAVDFLMTQFLALKNAIGDPVYFSPLSPLEAITTGGDTNTQIYYLDETQQEYLSTAETSYQIIPLDINKSTGNPQGAYALTLIKKDRVI